MRLIHNKLRRQFLLISLLFLFTSATQADESGALDCLIEPEMVVQVSSPVDGVVETMFVDTTDIIKTGQPLAQLESSIEQADLALAKIRAQINDEITAKKINRKFAKIKMSRIQELFKTKSASSGELDEVKTELALAEHEYQQAKNNKRVAELGYDKARKILAKRTIKSPINGVVVERYVSPGESVKDRPLFKLAQIDPLKIRVIVPSELFGSIKPGTNAWVLPESTTDNAIDVTVSQVDRVIDASSGTFGVWLTLPNKNNQIPSGLKCKVRFNLQK